MNFRKYANISVSIHYLGNVFDSQFDVDNLFSALFSFVYKKSIAFDNIVLGKRIV